MADEPNTPTPPPEDGEDETTPEQPQGDAKPVLFDAPKDVDEELSIGHAIYDTTSGRFRGPVKRGGKPTKADVKAALPKGHQHAIVRV